MSDEHGTAAAPRIIHVEPDSELDHVLQDVEATPVELEQRGVRYKITRMNQQPSSPKNLADKTDIWAGYDPERLQRALQASSGAFRGVDGDLLKRDLAEQRSQDSMGRSA